MSTFLQIQQTESEARLEKTITSDYFSQNFWDSQSEGIPDACEVILSALPVGSPTDRSRIRWKFNEETYELGQILAVFRSLQDENEDIKLMNIRGRYCMNDRSVIKWSPKSHNKWVTCVPMNMWECILQLVHNSNGHSKVFTSGDFTHYGQMEGFR